MILFFIILLRKQQAATPTNQNNQLAKSNPQAQGNPRLKPSRKRLVENEFIIGFRKRR